jgi:hypothetical protein
MWVLVVILTMMNNRIEAQLERRIVEKNVMVQQVINFKNLFISIKEDDLFTIS